MADTPAPQQHINSVCKLVMISGEIEFAAPFVGVSTQVDVMQDFMETDMLPVMEFGAYNNSEPEAPEVLELKGEVAKGEAESGLWEKVLDIATYSPGTPIYRGMESTDAVNSESPNLEQSVQELFQTFADMRSRGDGEEETPKVVDPAQPGTWSFAKIAPIMVATGTVVTQFSDQICKGIKFVMPGLAKIGAAVARYAPNVARIVAKFGASGAMAALLPVLGTFGDKFKTIATVLGTIAQMISEFMQTYMMVSQFQSLNDYAKYLSPDLGAFNDTINSVEDMLTGAYEQSTHRGIDEEGQSRGTVTPTDPTKIATKVKRTVIDNPKNFTLNTGMRLLYEKLPIFEALLKKLILSLNSKIDPVDGPAKVYSITDVLYESLNYTPPKGSTGTLGGPPHEWSLAEIMSKGIPVIEVTDPITKKKTQISVFELIMKAQDAKVVELGPGFLKWYTELDVLQHYEDVISTPKTGI